MTSTSDKQVDVPVADLESRKELGTKKEIQSWLEAYKKQSQSHCPQFHNKIETKKIILYTVNINKLHNFDIPDDYEQHEISVKFSITLFDEKKKQFFSRTYHSAEHPLVVGIQSEQNLQYFHEPFWAGFYGHDDIDLMSTKAVIEITYFKNDTSLISNSSSTLGFTMINLGLFLPEYTIYQGSARAVNDTAPLKKVGKMFIEAELQRIIDEGQVSSLVGLYNLFGQDDQVIGLMNQIIHEPNSLPNCKMADCFDILITNLQVSIHQAIEITLLEECNKQCSQRFRTFQPVPNQLVSFRAKSIQIVCHNGWKAINKDQFKNCYTLSVDSSNKKQDFNNLEIKNQSVKVDNCYKDSILLFQIVYELDIMINIIGLQSMVIYVGWCAVPVNQIIEQNGEHQVILDILGGQGHSFDRNGFFSQLTGQSPGKITVRLQLGNKNQKFFQSNKKPHSNISQDQIQVDKNSNQSTLKRRIIEKTKQRNEQIKLGTYIDEKTFEQRKKMNDIIKSKEQTQTIVEEIFDKELDGQYRTQQLVTQLQEIIGMADENLSVAQDKYGQQQNRLKEYTKRKDMLQVIDNGKLLHQSMQFDEWFYEHNTHPNIQIYYNIHSLKEFILQSDFGYHEIKLNTISLLRSQCAKGILPNTMKQLCFYLAESLQQVVATKMQKRLMKIEIELLSFSPFLKFMTPSSKDEFTIPSFHSLENPLPTSLIFVSYIFGQPKITSKKVIYTNGSTKETFDHSLKQNMPLFLTNEDHTPVLISLIVPEQLLYEKYAVIEIWNGDNHCIFGKFFLPLFTTKKLDKIASSQQLFSPIKRNAFYSRPQSKEQSIIISPSKDEEKFNNKLKLKKLPVPVFVSCDIIAHDIAYILGTIEACAFMSVAETIAPISKLDIQIQNKSKIYSVRIVNDDVLDHQDGDKQQVTRYAESKQNDILSEKLKLDPQMQHLIQADTIRDQMKESFVKQILDESKFPNIQVKHCIGTKDFISYTLINQDSHECSFQIEIEEAISVKDYGCLVLVVDKNLWKMTADRLKIIYPKIVNDQYNQFTQGPEQNNTYSILVPPKTETIILFYYSATLPCLSQKKNQEISKKIIKVLVRSQNEKFSIVGGMNVVPQVIGPIINDNIQLWVRANNALIFDLPNPLLLWANNMVSPQNQTYEMELYTPDFPITLEQIDMDKFYFKSEESLEIEQEIQIYIIFYSDEYSTITLHVCRIVIRGCEYLDALVTEGKTSTFHLPIMFDSPDQITFKTSRPLEGIIYQKMKVRLSDQRVNPIKGFLLKVPLQVMTFGDDKSCTKVACVQYDQICFKTFLVFIKPQLNSITLLYDVECPSGKTKEISFLYKNKVDQTINIKIIPSHKQLLIPLQSVDYKPLQTKSIRCVFQPEFLLNKIQIKVFLQDQANNFFDCIMFRVTYTN